MRFSSLALALLPAVALADNAASTTTQTSTKVLTKTYFLSQVHTVTSVFNNATSTYMTTAVSTAETTETTDVAVVTSSAAPSPTVVDKSAGSALEAGKLAVAGVAGMVIVALM